MDTGALKKFAARTRKDLINQVARRLEGVLPEGSDARREFPKAMGDLDRAIAKDGKEVVVDRVAYTWFNRFVALRYMDVSGYLMPRVVSPADGDTLPEILAQAVQGVIPDHVRQDVSEHVQDLLENRIPSREPQVEAYRRLVVASCNELHGLMPFLFEQIADYSELLMPNELLAETGWVAELRDVMTPETCQDVEVIGWLYQFYISEKKDQVFADLKKNKKITSENIPAATQLFTPHWIVRYLVENSLGRLWMLNNPGSDLVSKMEYYIAPEEPETDFLKINSPEEIKICDPAAGSGHMLTYAFDLLYEIYIERGYSDREIPGLILTHNLTGIEIDDRAGGLAAFALMMKAAAKMGRRRFLRMEARPTIVVLEDVEFSDSEMKDVEAVVGKDLFTDELRETLRQFEQAKNFGSLIVPKLCDPAETLRVVEARDFGGDLLLKEVQARVVAVLRMAEALSPKYHVVVANPPYMGGKGMNGGLQDFIKAKFADVKSDLFSAFIVRNTQMALPKAQLGFMTPFVWMFISSYENLRLFLLEHKTITSLVQLEYSGFDGATVPICTFTLENSHRPEYKGGYVRLSDFRGAKNQAPRTLEAIQNPSRGWFYRASAQDFKKIPGNPIAYWLSENLKKSFANNSKLAEFCPGSFGMSAGDPSIIHQWHEASLGRIRFGADSPKSFDAITPFAPYDKGGEFRRWYGNKCHIINWKNDGAAVRANKKAAVRNAKKFCQPHVSWTLVTSGLFSSRRFEGGYLLDTASNAIYDAPSISHEIVAGILNSCYMKLISPIINPTLNFSCGVIDNVPVANLAFTKRATVAKNVKTLEEFARSDWDAYETSWDFSTLPLLSPDHRGETLADSYATLRAHWQSMTDEMQALEEENNRIFIDAYGLQDELTPDVPIEEITLTCNPHYSIKGDHDDETREAKLLTRTMEEFVSYAVGCMFGRYSLDVPGLVLANQGETLQDYLARVPEPSFMPDADNVIPVLGDDRFEDDAYARFRSFLSTTFGADHLDENLAYIREALGRDVKDYLSKKFFDDHVTRYKKRPIYWMISSPKGAFQALIYMHRYNQDTLNIVLTRYVRPLRDKLEASIRDAESRQISAEATTAQRNKAGKEIDLLNKQISELLDWERDFLYPMALERKTIDLDDGVKKNYPEFNGVLKPVKGLSDG